MNHTHFINKEELTQAIEQLRYELYKCCDLHGIQSPPAVELSEQLDELLNLYQRSFT